MRPSGTHLYKKVCPSVGPCVGESVTPMQKPRFSAVFGYGEILHWNKWSTNMFWESFHPSVCTSASSYICHMINTRWDSARTHRCPVGLVFYFLSTFIKFCICKVVPDYFSAQISHKVMSESEMMKGDRKKWRCQQITTGGAPLPVSLEIQLDEISALFLMRIKVVK